MTPLSREERLDAFLLTAMLAAEYPHMQIQLDLVHREIARRFPSALGAAETPPAKQPQILVLQDDGRIVPLTYGIDPAWTIVDLHRDRLSTAWDGFVAERWPSLRRRLCRAREAAADGRHGEVVDWHTLVRHYALAERDRPAPMAPCVGWNSASARA